jgi:RHS repeat-associated protein
MTTVERSAYRRQRNEFGWRKARIASVCMVVAALVLANSVPAVQAGPITATIYVGRHFEVRDHDQPTKYVFNGSTRVAEITGSLSTNLRVQRLRLFPGWNLCSLAVSGAFPAGGAEAIAAAYQWNPGTGDYSPVTLGQTLAAGTVLWVKASTNAVLSILGSYTEPVAQPIQPGGTYVPGPGLEAWSPSLPDSASSWSFDASNRQWSDHLAGGLASVSGPPPALSPGQAFYVETVAPASLEIPDSTLRIRYYHEDHLGSSSVITDSSGQLVEESAFYPFSVARNQFAPRQVHDPYQFTQKERDRESSLHYFEARYLEGPCSRFLSADRKYANPDALSPGDLALWVSNPQEINLYSYVRNNPLAFTDPSGLDGGPRAPQPRTLVLYLPGMYEDARHVTGMSRAEYERALKQTYQQEAGSGGQITVKYIGSHEDLSTVLKGSSYSTLVIRSHAFHNYPGLILKMKPDETVQDDIPLKELVQDISGAKSAPAHLYLYGCDTAKDGLAPSLSQSLPDTQVTGSLKGLDMTYPWTTSGRGRKYSVGENRDYNATYSGGKETSNAMKIDVSKSVLPP